MAKSTKSSEHKRIARSARKHIKTELRASAKLDASDYDKNLAMVCKSVNKPKKVAKRKSPAKKTGKAGKGLKKAVKKIAKKAPKKKAAPKKKTAAKKAKSTKKKGTK